MDPIVSFEDMQGGALYVTALGAVGVGITWIESTHSLLAGCIAGASSIALLLTVAALIRMGDTARRSMQ